MPRITSYNVRVDTPEDGDDAWPRRRDDLAALVQSIDPDLVGFQEVLATQLRDLRDRLPEHLVVGRSRGAVDGPDEHVPIGYRRGRYALADLSIRWLSETPTRPGSIGWDAAHPRIATRAIVHDADRDDHLALLNAHFDHEGERARRESAVVVRSFVDDVDRDVPVVVVGDFNCPPGSPPHDALTASREDERDLFDAADLAADRSGPDTTHNDYAEPVDGMHIDHVFVTETIDVQRYEVRPDARENGRYPSDHFPVVVDLTY